MGDEQVKVVLGSLDHAIEELAGFSSEIEQQIGDLQGRVAELHARWEGDAAAAHAQAQSEWAIGARMLADGINAMHRVSTKAHRDFETAIMANKARFS
ncbi:WXG100 family type VII secretion target [Mycolicibacterium llatzerense]|uniref:WXG100 family type VII secretion target n=1 Tax=Mycolicibacterium llatzerense TaxID=280871 RepID=UPI0005BB7934|nr:WXG100 family type VII secretion target [Mycolicibacterium llatzerense]MCT7369143.1 type VII secretion protein [Mycolicibacterium llatzerense]